MTTSPIEAGEFVLRRKPWIIPLCRPLLDFVFLYHRLMVEGADHLPEQGPALLLVKHRATRDTPLVGMILHRYTQRGANYFMKGKASLLLNGIMEIMGGIKVTRPKDVWRVKNRAKRKAYIQQAREGNEAAMAYVAWLYSQGEIVVAYPEGMFYPDQIGPLQPEIIKQVFDIEQENDYQIPIIPIGLEYESLTKLRSKLFIRVGTPLYSTSFEEEKELVTMVQHRLSELSGFDP